jgi:hypothetical protein
VVFEAATSERSKLEREGGLDLVDLMDASARTTFLATLLRWITSLGRNDDRKSPREFDWPAGVHLQQFSLPCVETHFSST